MMNRFQFLLNKLAEECNEVGQIALKTAQFGADEVKPGQAYTNMERVHLELNDIKVIVEMLNQEFDFQYRADPVAVAAKINKVNKYWTYSKSLGMVQDE